MFPNTAAWVSYHRYSENLASWTFMARPLYPVSVVSLLNPSSKRKSDDNRRGVVEKFGSSSPFVIHLERLVVKLKYDSGGGGGAKLSHNSKTTKCRPVREWE
ncbi:hypothetical protein AVEN_253598-1 [Araneus ventricosus]|uniref:Uncharacterized protein n=1 Tax=Araneus ventricosus TaxID=182803 RepID=A0A4Y2CA50_ARAVE|nr:hypothetical protein AVEN_253598-1 [Araneus ventricosus]